MASTVPQAVTRWASPARSKTIGGGLIRVPGLIEVTRGGRRLDLEEEALVVPVAPAPAPHRPDVAVDPIA